MRWVVSKRQVYVSEHLERRLAESALVHVESARNTARAFDSALLAAECGALGALVLKRLGRADEAEAWRADAEAGFEAYGAIRLLQQLREDWRAVRTPR